MVFRTHLKSFVVVFAIALFTAAATVLAYTPLSVYGQADLHRRRGQSRHP